ncbi:MAG: hypothetical protein F6K19_44430 [Cyanothece sp. SIO1E1]|nr:hypothetical protein [Cyanothece sp. SIO1E1]
MATALPSILVVIDMSVLAAGDTREWNEVVRVGACLIPQVVLDEMRFLFDRALDPELQRLAREFRQFYVNSGWLATDAVAPHPALKGRGGESLSKRARLSLSVSKCAYGVATANPRKLVVLATNEQPQLKKIQALEVPNLCSVTGSALLQWSRTGRRPIAASQRLQLMKVAQQEAFEQSKAAQKATSKTAGQSGLFSARSSSATVGNTTISTSYSSSTRPSQGKSKSSRRSALSPSMPSRPGALSQTISLLLAIAGLAIAGLLLWYLFNAQASKQPRSQELSKIKIESILPSAS